MNLIMKDFEEHFLAHHPGHVHLEPGATAHSGSSRRRLQSASRHFSLRQPCLPTSVPPVCSYWTMLQFTRTHLPMEVAGTFFWQPGAWDPSARRATGLLGACAGCWWVGSREMRRFQLRQQMGAKNAKKGESESKKEQKMMHAQRATLIQVGSCRVTNALLLLLAQALHFLLQEALARLLLSFCKHGWSRSSHSRTAPSSHRGALQQRWRRRAGWWARAARSGHCDRGEQEGRLLVPSLLS